MQIGTEQKVDGEYLGKIQENSKFRNFIRTGDISTAYQILQQKYSQLLNNLRSKLTIRIQYFIAIIRIKGPHITLD